MSHTILFKQGITENGNTNNFDPLVNLIRQAARAEGWVGIPGFKQWAKETYNATLRSGKYDNWTSISFRTEQDLNKFKQNFGVEE